MFYEELQEEYIVTQSGRQPEYFTMGIPTAALLL